MAIKSSGSLSFADIRNEFGGSTPASLGNYYRGGSLVPNGPTENNNIPTSGAIRFSDFYGASKVFNTTFTGNFIIMDLRVELVNRGWNQSSPVRAYFAPGTIVRSYSPDSAALDISGSFPNGIKVVIDGATIAGCGGFGGNGAGFDAYGNNRAGTAGGRGGPAIRCGTSVSIENLGWILGGGGGGGGGAATCVGVSVDKSNYTVYMSGGGGGGGMDWVQSSYGTSGTTPSSNGYRGGNGGYGNNANPGSGGQGGLYNNVRAGSGGSGGSWGAPGVDGGDPTGSSAVVPRTFAGAGGSAILGNNYITWISYGTRLGAIE
ncbi:MAG: hypothetical protein ACK4OH_10910 [Acidovorax temperans]|uniref:hypothetical protein n=1 Tax=Acidovorax temperans TaxID=80878 RepID=UPI003918AE23